MASSFFTNAAANPSFLSEADDLLTRLMFDICVFGEDKVNGRRTGKMDKRGRPETRLQDSDIASCQTVLQQLRTASINIAPAVDSLCDLKPFKAFANKYQEEDEDLFRTHVRRYVAALRPDTGVAFHETDRYSGIVQLSKSAKARQTPSPTPPPPGAAARTPASFIEVGVFATRRFKKGEIIKLQGGVAELSEEEDDEMRAGGGRSDFSVLWSERKKCFCLLLGPARFVNHDCRNNVVFHLSGNTMTFKVVEDIGADEEIFTHYGDHYFDTANAGCLCATCQKLKRGAFAPKQPAKPRASAPAAPTSPTRRNPSRASLGGHELTAKRSVSRPTSSASARSLSPASEEKRRSERTSTPVDDLRTGPRIVQPKLKPPPGYIEDYLWDPKKRSAKYIGPTGTAPPSPSKKVVTTTISVTSVSKTALGKRRRAASPDSDSESVSSSSTAPPRKTQRKKKPPGPKLVAIRKVTLGTRTSSRNGADKSVSARANSFQRLSLALGGSSGDDLSDLSDEEDQQNVAHSDEGGPFTQPQVDSSEESEGGVSEQEVAASLLGTPVKSPPKDREKAGGKHDALHDASPSGKAQAASIYEEQIVAAGSQAQVVLSMAIEERRREVEVEIEVEEDRREKAPLLERPGPWSPGVNDGGPETPLEEDVAMRSPVSGSVEAVESKDCGSPLPSISNPQLVFTPVPPPFPSVSPTLRNVTNAVSPADGSTDDSTSDKTNNTSSTDQSSSSATTTMSSDRAFGVNGSSSGVPNGGAAGGDGGDDDDKGKGRATEKVDEAMMDVDEVEVDKAGAAAEQVGEEAPEVPSTPKVPATPGGLSESGEPRRDSDTREAAALLLSMLNTIPDLPFASAFAPSPTSATSPPKPNSSNASAGSSTTNEGNAAASSSSLAKKRGRVSMDIDPASNPRSTRRNSHLDPPPPPSSRIGKAIARSSSSRSPKPSGDTKPTVVKKASFDKPRPSTSGEGRSTRLSAPIAGGLADILGSPAVTSVSGGYDWQLGRYVARPRTPLPPPPPPPQRSPSPPPRVASAPLPRPKPLIPTAKPSPIPKPPPARPNAPRRSQGPLDGDLRRFASTNLPARRMSESALPTPIASGSRSPFSNSTTPGRSSRRTQPIEGSLRDLISSPEVSAVAGGFDASTGRYTSTNRKVSSAPPETESPDASLRATRRSNPINVGLGDLLASPAVVAAAGGFDAASGKYRGVRKTGNESRG